MKRHDGTNIYQINMVPQKESYLLFSNGVLDAEYGCIGHLRADFGDSEGFWHTWWDHGEELKTQAFKDELDAVIGYLRRKGNMLHSLSELTKYCYSHRDARLGAEYDGNAYGFKIDTQTHIYYIRATPIMGAYHIYCYCYQRERLEKHLATAKAKEG